MTDTPPIQPTLIREVFISYASQDKAVADAVVGALERAGLKCWIAPRDVRAGAQYADAIVRALSGAKAMVLVLSANAVNSSHVGKEIERASSKKRPIIALRTDAAELTPALEYFLSESQWIEVQPGKEEAAYAKLIDAIRDPAHPAPTSGPASTPATPTPSSAIQPKSRRNRMLLAAGLAIVAVTLTALFAPKFWLAKHPPAEQPSTTATPASAISDKSIAVLPFVDMSEKHDQEYFSDGLSEELIDHLAHITDLKVIARTSSFAFKGKNEDMRTIATKLGVANLLEGSVRKSGGTLRITAQLIRASDGVHRWSETYDRKLNDIFKVQDEISTTVAKELNVALNVSNSAVVQPASKGTVNIEAYNLLLQGNYFYDRSDQGDGARAVERYQQALKLDPHYALAWAKLARVYAWQGNVGELSSTDSVAKVRDAVERALSSDPNCAAAYYARGNVLFFVAGDWAAARSAFERAVVLDSHGEWGDRAQGNIQLLKSALSGNLGEMVDGDRSYLESNPMDTTAMWDLSVWEQMAGQLEASAATSRRLLELYPGYATAQAQYGLTLLLLGKKAEALEAVQKETDEANKLAALACVYWAMGRRAESDSAVGNLERGFRDRSEYLIASAHACRAEADAAFEWLERTYQQRRGTLFVLRVDPLLRNLRADPRFDAFLRKAKLTE
jgi:TolB-like protein